MQHILDAILAGDTTPEDFAALELPESYRGRDRPQGRGRHVRGPRDRSDKDPRKSLHLDDVRAPRARPGRGARRGDGQRRSTTTPCGPRSSSRCSTFGFLERYGRISPLSKRHDLPYHVVGSDLAGVVLATGPGVHSWKPGDEVVAHCLSVELESPDGHNDTMLDPEQRIWGFETNFGGLAHIALVKSNQLMPKPDHLTWEEAASPGLVNSTAYRQLVSRNGAGMKQGDNVLIWGASRRPRRLRDAVRPQRRRHPGLRRLQRGEGRDLPQDGRRADHQPLRGRTTSSGRTSTPRTRRSGAASAATIRELTGGEDVDIVFEHPGRETFGASVFAARKGGTIVTCASTSGYMHQYDNRYLWMNLKRIIGSHFANYRESWEANRLIAKGMIHPTLSQDLPARRGRPGRARRAPQPPPGQGRRALPGPRGGPRRARPGDARPAPRRDQPLPRASERAAVTGLQPPARGCRRSASRGVGSSRVRSDTTGRQRRRDTSGKRKRYMSDQGLSIFDDEPEDDADDRPPTDEPTQVIPAVEDAEQSAGPTASAGPAVAAGEPGRAAARTPSQRPRRPPARPRQPAPAAQAQPPAPSPPPAAPRGRVRRRAPVASRSSAAAATTRPRSTRSCASSPARRPASAASLTEAQQRVSRARGRSSRTLRERARREREPDVRRARRPGQRDAAAGRGAGRRGPRRGQREAAEIREQATRDAEAIRGRGRPRGRGHAGRPAQGARGDPQPA